eukprot:1663750-Rhodomonas_salina.1
MCIRDRSKSRRTKWRDRSSCGGGAQRTSGRRDGASSRWYRPRYLLRVVPMRCPLSATRSRYAMSAICYA